MFTRIVIAALGAATLSTAAHAADVMIKARPLTPESGTFQRIVSYADLSLGTAEGKAMLMRRIHSAASDGCAEVYSSEALNTTMMWRHVCVRTSVDATRPKVERLAQLAAAGQGSGSITLAFAR